MPWRRVGDGWVVGICMTGHKHKIKVVICYLLVLSGLYVFYGL